MELNSVEPNAMANKVEVPDDIWQGGLARRILPADDCVMEDRDNLRK